MRATTVFPRVPSSRPVMVAGLVLALVAGACQASSPSAPAPAGSGAAPTAAVPEVSPSQAAVPTPAPTLAPPSAGVLIPGVLAETVTAGLRVRSAPGVRDDSVKHTPLLPQGTQLVVTGGPVDADGYTWYRVAPLAITLDDRVDQGWVAIADHDGTPWVAAVADATPGFELASVQTDPIEVSLDAAKARAAAINRFGLALYARLRDAVGPDAGIVFSPYSVATALAMARAGANGETAAQMDEVASAEGWDAVARGSASLADVLARRDGAWTVRGDGDTGTHFLSLRIANMAFAQDGYALEEAYLRRVAGTFRSGFGLVDYTADPAAATDAINGWVGRQTLGRIPRLLNPGEVTDATRLVLVNAMYFKGEWEVPFYRDATMDRPFTTLGGNRIRVPTMETRGGQSIPIASGDGWQATELRYLGPDQDAPLAMTIILPRDLARFEANLDAETLDAITTRVARERDRLQEVTGDPESCGEYAYEAHLFMPKFGTETRANLSEMLAAMGMPDAFDAATADFSGMTTQDRLYLAFVIHQANIDVDERGTEAAAATAVGVDTGGCTGPLPAKERTLRLDRPFLYLVRDLETGAVLFMGRVADPTRR